MSLQVLREVFNTDLSSDANILKGVIATVHQRGVDIAYQAIADKAAMGDADVRITVDGANGRQIGAWKKTIRLSWGGQTALAELIDFVWLQVQRRTPVDSGTLRASWTWWLNGNVLAAGGTSGTAVVAKLGTMSFTDQLRLVNTQPYIRKAEVNYTKRGIAEASVKAAKRKFRGFIVVDSWIEIPGVVVSRGIRASLLRRLRHRTDQRIPTVLILKSRKSTSVSGDSSSDG